MQSYRKFTLRFLGGYIEAINFPTKELGKILRTIALIFFAGILVWRAPEIIAALAVWGKS